jgi:diguanylate cyclase (GGDEF)-like protein/PAS domain S-box-containing protein
MYNDDNDYNNRLGNAVLKFIPLSQLLAAKDYPMISAQSYTDIQTTLTLATEMATDFAKAFKGKAVPSLPHAKAQDQDKFQLHSQAVVPLVLLAETQAPHTPKQAKTPVPIAPQPPLNVEPQLLRSIIEHMVEPMFLVNKNGIIEAINPEGAKLFGAPKIELIGQKLSQYFCSDARTEYEGLFQGWRDTLETQLNHGPKEVLLKRSDGLHLEVDLSLSYIPASIPQGGHNGESVFIGVMHNLSSHKAEYKELRRLARTDCLTQLANRHAFDEVLQRNWNECANHGMPLSLVIIDVDYFKQFNDAHGHVQGDECLRRIAKVIQAALPSRHCLAARYGGEEFAIILPGCNGHIAEATARRIQQQINRLAFTQQGLDASVSVSVSQGVACERNGQFRTPTALLCAADTALYRAKSDGRDRINLSQ